MKNITLAFLLVLPLLVGAPALAQTYTTTAECQAGYNNPNLVYDPVSNKCITPASAPTTGNGTAPSATTGSGNINYIPLEPLPGTPAQYNDATSLSQYLSNLYKIAVTVGGLLAVTLLVIGGVRYMLSEAFTDITKAKKQMWGAVWGLLVVVGSFLILYSINPNLLQFNLNIGTASTGTPVNTISSGSVGSNTNLVTTSALTNDQYNQLNTALNKGLIGATNVPVGAYPTTNPTNDPNVNAFQQQCQNYGTPAAQAVAGGAATAGYFIGGTLGAAAGGVIALGSAPIYTANKIPGDQIGLSSNTTVITCSAFMPNE